MCMTYSIKHTIGYSVYLCTLCLPLPLIASLQKMQKHANILSYCIQRIFPVKLISEGNETDIK